MGFTLLAIAGLGAVAIVVGKLARRVVPEVVVFLVLGVLIGPDGPLPLIGQDELAALDLVIQLALGAIIFLIGDRLRIDELSGMRRVLVPVNVAHIVASGGLVFLATRWVGADVRLATVLALIAAETGVLTVTALVREERAQGPVTDLLLSSVGLTNVAVAALFGLAFPFVLAGTGEAGSGLDLIRVFAQIVLASAAIGVAGGWLLRVAAPLAETSGELLLLLLLVLVGMVGADLVVGGSVVVSTLTAGLYVANVVPWLADRLFAAVRVLEAPIYLVFFLVAGAGIHLDRLAEIGLLGGAYVVARALGKVGGAALGGLLGSGRDGFVQGARLGMGLLPHAGMAIGLAAFTVEQARGLGEGVSAVVLASIVVFELSGPVFARQALRRVGEAGAAGSGRGRGKVPEIAGSRGFERVLVPVGNIEVILPRLAFLLDLVDSLGAELVAVHVSRPGSGVGPDHEPQLLELVRRVAEERGVVCTTVHRVGEQIATEIVAVSAEQEADLIVMGEPARQSLFEPSHWGVIAQRVVARSQVPVLVYPVDPSDPGRVPRVYVRRGLRAQAEDAGSGTLPAREQQ